MIVLGEPYEGFTLVVNRSNTDPEQVTYHLFRADGWNEATSREDSINLGDPDGFMNPIFAEAKRRYDDMERPKVGYWNGDRLEELGVWHGPTPLFSSKTYEAEKGNWILQVTVCKQVWETKFNSYPGYDMEELSKGCELIWLEKFQTDGALDVINGLMDSNRWECIR